MLKKIVILVVVLAIGSQSIYFRTLSELEKDKSNFQVDASTIENIYNIGILNNDIITPLEQLISAINSNTEVTFKEKGNRMGIGASAYFLVKGTAVIRTISDGQLLLDNGSIIDAKYIFGNELRDASRYLSLEDFSSQTELNVLTESFNAYVRNQINIDLLSVGDSIAFIGASRIDKRALPLKSILIIPAKIETL